MGRLGDGSEEERRQAGRTNQGNVSQPSSPPGLIHLAGTLVRRRSATLLVHRPGGRAAVLSSSKSDITGTASEKSTVRQPDLLIGVKGRRVRVDEKMRRTPEKRRAVERDRHGGSGGVQQNRKRLVGSIPLVVRMERERGEYEGTMAPAAK